MRHSLSPDHPLPIRSEVRRVGMRCARMVAALGVLLIGLVSVASAACGDTVLDPGEDCEAPFGACCNVTTCEFESAATVCRAGSGDSCDPDEMCMGSSDACPSDTVLGAGIECYAGSGDLCDPAKQCSGVPAESCPVPTTEPGTTLCRSGSGDLCDPDELCTGTPGQGCPSDSVEPGTTLCRVGSGDLCDADEFCSGNASEACPTDAFESGATVCRTGSGDLCDPDETCPGSAGGACPADSVEAATTVCRVGSGDPNGTGFVCDPDELCTGAAGVACPGDSVTPGGTVCNAGSGDPHGSGVVCDPDEECSGAAGVPCSTDAFATADTVCRTGLGGSFAGEIFTCDGSERCPGAADGECPADTTYSTGQAQTVRAMRDARTMETHRTSNNGATGLFWLKRSPNVRGIIGFDTSCQAAAMPDLDCALLDMTIHEGLPTLDGASFSAHVLNVPWVEGNQAFDSFSWKGNSLGSFPGTGVGTTWGCRIDLDLAAGGSHDCDTADRWWGGDICGGGTCYTPTSTWDAPFVDDFQEKLGFDLTADLVGHTSEISYILKVTDEEDIDSGSVKLYQRDGARFVAETDPATPPSVAFDLAPQLLLYGPGLVAPLAVLVEPVSQSAIGLTIEVAVDQVGAVGGNPARWENKTLGTWGYMSPGLIEDWEATIPLQSGANEVEFTVFDACNTEGQGTYTLTSAPGMFCGNDIVEPGEECDDGNGVSGDCCSGTCEIETNGSICDDGDICTQASTCSAGVCVGTGRIPTACGDSYMCYKSGITKGTSPFLPLSDHDLVDPFGANQADIRLPKALCLPASVDGASVFSSLAHHVAYRSKERTKRPLPPAVEVTDRFGTISVDPLKVTRVLTPAGYALDAAATPLGAGIVNHHECYRAKLTQGKFPKGTTVAVAESLEDRLYEVLKPSELCLAVDSDGGGVDNPNAHLMCYRVKRRAGESKHQKVRDRIQTEDDFGTLRMDTRREESLCVPATIGSPIL